MTSLRFKVGDQAIYLFARGGTGQRYVGTQMEVIGVGPFTAGTSTPFGRMEIDCDYLIQAWNGARGQSKDYQLRKIDPPPEPACLTRQTEREVEA